MGAAACPAVHSFRLQGARSSPPGVRDVTRAEGSDRLRVSRIPQSERSSRGKDDRTAEAHTGKKETFFFCFSAMAMFIACGWTFLPAFYQVWTCIIIFGFSASSYFKAGSRVCGFSVLEIHGKPLKLFTYLDEDVLSEETKKTAL